MRRVLYIGGAARSGSTLLSEMLGAQSGVLNVGELSLFWRDAERGGMCACGTRIPCCDLWGKVLDRLRTSQDLRPAEYGRLAQTRAALAHTSRPRRLLYLRSHPNERSRDERRLIEATNALVDEALTETGASLLVDSSKTLPAFLFHQLSPDVDLRLIHLTRDPRAVIASTVRSQGVTRGNSESLPPGGSAAAGLLRWAWANGSIALGARSTSHRVIVPYEKLMEHPESLMRWLCRFADVGYDPSTVQGDRVTLGRVSHAAVGNPGRGASSRVLQEDDRWRVELPGTTQRLVSAVSWPLEATLSTVGGYEAVGC